MIEGNQLSGRLFEHTHDSSEYTHSFPTCRHYDTHRHIHTQTSVATRDPDAQNDQNGWRTHQYVRFIEATKHDHDERNIIRPTLEPSDNSLRVSEPISNIAINKHQPKHRVAPQYVRTHVSLLVGTNSLRQLIRECFLCGFSVDLAVAAVVMCACMCEYVLPG